MRIIKMKFIDFLNESTNDLNSAVLKFIKLNSTGQVHSLKNIKNFYSKKSDTYFSLYAGLIEIDEEPDNYVVLYSAKLNDGKYEDVKFYTDGYDIYKIIDELKLDKNYNDVKVI